MTNTMMLDATAPRPLAAFRLRTAIGMRWFAVAGQLGVVIAVHFGFGFPLPLGPLLAVCLLYTSPSPRDATLSRMPSSA